ncbi:hypothetical protein NOF04DRAFT_1271275 [Fusarium oxysporum II5]|nr:hypothetical protein NOF04DRAFT_1271275 [Fusarium oxysporum II5]
MRVPVLDAVDRSSVKKFRLIWRRYQLIHERRGKEKQLSQKRGAYTNKTRREQQRRILGCREDEEEEEEATAVVEGDLRGWEWEWEELVMVWYCMVCTYWGRSWTALWGSNGTPKARTTQFDGSRDAGTTKATQRGEQRAQEEPGAGEPLSTCKTAVRDYPATKLVFNFGSPGITFTQDSPDS